MSDPEDFVTFRQNDGKDIRHTVKLKDIQRVVVGDVWDTSYIEVLGEKVPVRRHEAERVRALWLGEESPEISDD